MTRSRHGADVEISSTLKIPPRQHVQYLYPLDGGIGTGLRFSAQIPYSRTFPYFEVREYGTAVQQCRAMAAMSSQIAFGLCLRGGSRIIAPAV